MVEHWTFNPGWTENPSTKEKTTPKNGHQKTDKTELVFCFTKARNNPAKTLKILGYRSAGLITFLFGVNV